MNSLSQFERNFGEKSQCVVQMRAQKVGCGCVCRTLRKCVQCACGCGQKSALKKGLDMLHDDIFCPKLKSYTKSEYSKPRKDEVEVEEL